MFTQVLGDEAKAVGEAEFHKEMNDPVQSKLRKDCIATRLFECRQARAVLDREINALEFAVINK
jgi:hypothetical protein